MNLNEINDAIKQLQDKDDISNDVLKDTLESLELTRDEKLDNIASWIEKNNATTDWLKNKVDSFTKEKQRLIKQNKALMQYMTEVIDDSGYKTIKTKNHILKPRNYRASVVIEDSSKIPDQFKEKVEETKINKTLLYRELSDGQDIRGAKLVPNRKTIII